MFKCQQFKDSESDKTVTKVENHQHLDECNNKKWQSMDKYEAEPKLNTDRYILLLINTLLLSF